VMTGWWISWYHHPDDGSFELHSPWWITGYTIQEGYHRHTIVAAVMAECEDDAWDKIRDAYDADPVNLEERFCDELKEGKSLPWEHAGTRFELADWMQWPPSDVENKDSRN